MDTVRIDIYSGFPVKYGVQNFLYFLGHFQINFQNREFLLIGLSNSSPEKKWLFRESTNYAPRIVI
jgi:hypothetical protein